MALCALGFGLFSSCQKENVSSASETAAVSEKAASWISLFDGTTLNGWTQVPANSWNVTNGVLASKGTARGYIYTNAQFGKKYRLLFSMRQAKHPSGTHYGSVLIFNTPNHDAMWGIQFGLPNGAHWDYRQGHNDGGGHLFQQVAKPGFSYTEWSRVELLVDADAGTIRMAVAQPIGTKAVEVLSFTDPTAGKTGPIGFQMHNAGLFDEYKDIKLRENPQTNGLLTVDTPQ